MKSCECISMLIEAGMVVGVFVAVIPFTLAWGVLLSLTSKMTKFLGE